LEGVRGEVKRSSTRVIARRIGSIGVASDMRLTELLAWQAQVHKEEWLA